MKLKLSLFLLFASTFTHAENTVVQIQERMDNQRLQEMQPLDRREDNAAPLKTESNEATQTFSLSRQELIQQPSLLTSAMLTALATNNVENVLFLLPIYQQMSPNEKNSEIVQWATAIEAKYNQDYTKAIQLYLSLIHI